MTDKMDDLRQRVDVYLGNTPVGGADLIRDLWAWGQEKDADARAWKHANAFEPVTREQLAWPLESGTPCYSSTDIADKQLAALGTLYREKKP